MAPLDRIDTPSTDSNAICELCLRQIHSSPMQFQRVVELMIHSLLRLLEVGKPKHQVPYDQRCGLRQTRRQGGQAEGNLGHDPSVKDAL